MPCITPLEKAIELIDAGNNVFITGGGGVGKSYILNKLKEHYGEGLDITSTTGISAINVGGQTIHSWAGIGLAKKSASWVVQYKIRKNKSLERHIKECKLLAIDEVSMLSDKLIKYLDDVLRLVRECQAPFGGLQVIFIGDFFQLAPTKDKENQDVDYCFNSLTWQNLNFSTIYLKEVKRQSDKPYINALNNIRTGVFTKKDIQLFENRNFPSSTRIDKNILQLFPRKNDTSRYNEECLAELTTEPMHYYATDSFCRYDLESNKCNEIIDIDYPEKNSSSTLEIEDLSNDFSNTEKYMILNFNKQCNAPQKLVLKNGCRVMLLKNLNIEKKLVNGSCGQVTKLTKFEIEVLFDNGVKTKIEPVKFEYISEGKVKIKRQQYPLMLAYAINSHKSQGMTLDKLVVNFKDNFGDGMGYVVLSRTRTLDGLYLKGFNCDRIQTSPKVIQFYKDLVSKTNCYVFGEDGNIESENIIAANNTSEINVSPEPTESFEPEIEDTDEFANIEKSIDESARIASLEAQVTELKSLVEKLTKSKEIDIDNKNIEKYIKPLDEDSNYFVKAFGEFTQGNYDDALVLFKKCVSIEPSNDKAYFYIGCIYEIKEDMEKAIENYIVASKLGSKNPTYFDKLANLYFEDEEYEKASENWKQVLKLDPDYEINYLNKAFVEWAKDDANYLQAIIDCNTHLNKNPENKNYPLVYGIKGDSEYYLDKYEEALEDFNKVIELEDKENAADYHHRAKTYFQLGEYANAVEDWNKALELDPEYTIDYFDKGYANLIIEQYTEAIDDFTKYISMFSESDSAYNNRGLCKYYLEDYQGAIEDYNKAIEFAPDKTLYINNRAKAYYWLDEYEKALEDWNRVLELDPEFNINYYYKAYTENELSLYEDALSSIEKRLKDFQNDENALNLKNTIEENLEEKDDDEANDKEDNDNKLAEYLEKAVKHYENEEYQEAVDTWNKILEIDPEYEIDYFDKANAEYDIQQYSEAIADNTKYISMFSESDSAYYNRGLCKYYLEDYQGALEDYNKAIELEPNDILYLDNRAEAYYLLDEYEKALEDWNRVLELDPEFNINYYYKAYTENELGLYEDALSSIEKRLKDFQNNEDALNLKNTIEENLEEDETNKLAEYLEKAVKHYENEEYQEAVDTWNKILEIDPEYEIDYFDKAKAEYNIQQYSEAIADNTKYISMFSESDSAYNNRGVCKYYLEDYQGALDDCNKAIELNPNKLLYLDNRAEAYYLANEYEKALEDWNRVLELDPEFNINYHHKAYTENELGLYEDALSSIEKRLKDFQNDEDALNLKNTIEENLEEDETNKLVSEYIEQAKNYLEKNHYKNAYDCCQKILEIDKYNAYAHLYLGVYYYYQKDFSNAEKEYLQAIDIDETFAKAYYNLGVLYYDQGIYKSAIKYLELAEKYDPSMPHFKKLLR